MICIKISLTEKLENRSIQAGIKISVSFFYCKDIRVGNRPTQVSFRKGRRNPKLNATRVKDLMCLLKGMKLRS